MKSIVILLVVAACASFTPAPAFAAAGVSTGIILSSGAEKEASYLPVADVMPEPVGGLPAIVKHVVYPESARKFGIEGKVYLVAYINETGDVDDVKVIKGLQGGCEEAAVKAVKETKFTPGKQGGVAVKVQLSIPIAFKMAK